MELLVFKTDGSSPDIYSHGEEYEEEDGKLLIYPAAHHNSDATVAEYAVGMWVNTRRLLERGEKWPERKIEIPNTEEVQNPEGGPPEIGHLVRNFGNDESDFGN